MLARLAGVEVAFSLWKGAGRCGTLEEFLADSKFSIINKAVTCCPVFDLTAAKKRSA